MRILLVVPILSIAALPIVRAQEIPLLTLRPATGTLAQEFTIITSIRELRDGRVLITDPREAGLVVADFRTGKVEAISRKGRGPGEYEMAAPIKALAGDSTLLPDLLSRRWLVLDGAKVISTLPPDSPVILAMRGFVESADTLGKLMQHVSRPSRPGITVITERDSEAVVLFDRATGRGDTVAQVRPRPVRNEREVNEEGRTIRASSAPVGLLSPEEGAVLFPDGWLAIGRVDPFRVDWRRPNGSWVRGPPLVVAVVRMTARERAAFIRRNRASGALAPGAPDPDLPNTIPPFPNRYALLPASDGLLLILRSKSAAMENTRYLVVDRQGGLRGELSLPTSDKIIGFGRGSVYIVTTDDDGIQRLRRHPW
jgi:hypothetical protein